MDDLSSRHEVEDKWRRARRRAFWAQVGGYLKGEQSTLISFDEVANKLRLKNYRYLGVQSIPLEKIVGSVGRYQDFMRHFLPRVRNHDMKERWAAIAALYLDPTSKGVPPIEVFKVGDSYFVKDGNHRVSVGNSLGIPDIEAYVWEYQVELQGVTPSTNLDKLLLASERQEFLFQTHLADLRPASEIELTLPGGYLELLQQIVEFQEALAKIDQETIPFNKAVTDWYDMRYETIFQLIQRHNVLEHFPKRTPADLYVFVTRRHRELEAQHKTNIRMTQAINILSLEQKNIWQRIWEWIQRRARANS